MPVAQGRHGYVTIGGNAYPVYSWRLDNPRNLVAPQPVGNTWTTNRAEGLRTSRFTASMMVRERATEVLSMSWWNLFLSRTWLGGFDDTSASTIVVSNGKRLYTLANAKAESFTLTVTPGAPVGLSVVFVAPAQAVFSDHTPTDYINTVDSSPPLMFDRVIFGGIAGNVYGFELTYANNHLPDGRLNGTKNLSAWDAGSISCGAVFTFDARSSAGAPFADASTITAALAGAVTRTLSLTAVTANNPNDADADVGQRFQRHACLVQGTPTTAPLVVT